MNKVGGTEGVRKIGLVTRYGICEWFRRKKNKTLRLRRHFSLFVLRWRWSTLTSVPFFLNRSSALLGWIHKFLNSYHIEVNKNQFIDKNVVFLLHFFQYNKVRYCILTTPIFNIFFLKMFFGCLLKNCSYFYMCNEKI